MCALAAVIFASKTCAYIVVKSTLFVNTMPLASVTLVKPYPVPNCIKLLIDTDGFIHLANNISNKSLLNYISLTPKTGIVIPPAIVYKFNIGRDIFLIPSFYAIFLFLNSVDGKISILLI